MGLKWVICSCLIHTCQLCGANNFEYLTDLERHARELAANPSEDPLELPRDACAGGSMMHAGWPKRIIFGHAQESSGSGQK